MNARADSDPTPAGVDNARTGSTVLRVTGGDAMSLVHRLSTQTLEDLAPGAARPTLFCDFRGRLLHRAVAARTADGAVWLLRDDAAGSELASHLDRHIFRDDVRIEDLAAGLGVRPVDQGFDLPAGTVMESGGVPSRVQLEWNFGWEVGAARREPSADGERLRIAAGRPRHDHEIRDEFHPFEVGLAHEIHLSKGCFTGQEVLLRLVTYRGTRRHLAQVRGPRPLPSVPADLQHAGEPAGRLTSAAADDEGWIGLAVLRDSVGPQAVLATEEGTRVEVVGRFPETRPLGLP